MMSPFKFFWKLAAVEIASRKKWYTKRDINYIILTLNLLRKFLNNKNLAIMLELGCGSGRLLRNILRRYINALGIGLDIDVRSIENLNTLSNKHGLRILPVVADAEKIPFRESVFDVVLAFSILEHLPNIEKAVKEISRVTKPGGVVIVQIPNLDYIIEPHTSMLLPSILPYRLKEAIRLSMNYAYINWRAKIKYVRKLFLHYGFLEVAIISLAMFIPMIPNSFIIIFYKPK